MVYIILAVIAVAFILWFVDKKLLTPNTQTRNIVMFVLASIAGLGISSLIAYTMRFPSMAIGSAILIPLSLIFGAWFGWGRNRIASKFSRG